MPYSTYMTWDQWAQVAGDATNEIDAALKKGAEWQRKFYALTYGLTDPQILALGVFAGKTQADLDAIRTALNTCKQLNDVFRGNAAAAQYDYSACFIPWRIINYGTSVKDTDSAVTTGASWHFTCPAGKGGDYQVAAVVAFNTAPGTNPGLFVFKNGARTADLVNSVASATYGAGTGIAGAAVVTLAAGDTLDVRAFQNSGGNVALTTNAFENRITINRVFGS